MLHASTDMAAAEGTVYLYCKRVCQAILNLRDHYLSWPNQERREALKLIMEDYGFPGCIGILDATLIPLRDRPKKNGWSYFCRKKYYAVSILFSTSKLCFLTPLISSSFKLYAIIGVYSRTTIWAGPGASRTRKSFVPHLYIKNATNISTGMNIFYVIKVCGSYLHCLYVVLIYEHQGIH